MRTTRLVAVAAILALAATALAAIPAVAQTPSGSGGSGGGGLYGSEGSNGNTVTVQAGSGPTAPGHSGGSGPGGGGGGASSCSWTPAGGQNSISGYDPSGNIISSGGGYDSNGKLISPGTPGTWYSETCNGTYVASTFVPSGSPPPTGPSVSPATLAAHARSQLVAAAPPVQMSPATTHWQYVNLPTWAWLPAAQWVPLHATAAVPGVSVTATATPTQLVFSYQDGLGANKTITCNGHGTAYSDQLANAEFAAMPNPKPGLTSLIAPSPDCGWTWIHSAAGSPDEKLEVTAHVVYALTWAVTGAPGGGTLPPLNSATTTYRLTVGEIEALNTK
jgi:hypothetical protein